MIYKKWITRRFHNILQAAILLLALGVLLGSLGWVIGGEVMAVWALILGFLLMFLGPKVSLGFILSLYRATPISTASAPDLYAMVLELSNRAELDAIPMLYRIPSDKINALTVGEYKRSAILLTDGLIQALNSREMIGVLAHEISHIQHNDIFIMNMADRLTRLVQLLSFFGQVLLLIFLPVYWLSYEQLPWMAILLLLIASPASTLLQLALSRNREFDADADTVHLTGDALGLASALKKIEYFENAFWKRFFFPVPERVPISWLRSHPETEERIKKLLSQQELN